MMPKHAVRRTRALSFHDPLPLARSPCETAVPASNEGLGERRGRGGREGTVRRGFDALR
jgi:hypothetical protein